MSHEATQSVQSLIHCWPMRLAYLIANSDYSNLCYRHSRRLWNMHTQLLTRQCQRVSSCHCLPLAWLTCVDFVLKRHHWCEWKQKTPKCEWNFPNRQAAVSDSLSQSYCVCHTSTSTEQATPILLLPPQRSPDNRWKSQMKLISFCLFVSILSGTLFGFGFFFRIKTRLKILR